MAGLDERGFDHDDHDDDDRVDPRAAAALEQLRDADDLDRFGPPGRFDEVVERLLGRLDTTRLLAVAAVVAAAVVLGAGAVLLLRDRGGGAAALDLPFAGTSAPTGSGPTSGGGPATSTVGTEPSQVVVHAAGAVAAPGVYRLVAGARVSDLVVAAGGTTPDADVDRLNLAAPLADGQRLYVPRVGEAQAPLAVAPDGGAASAGGSGEGSGAAEAGAPIPLNTADATQLEELPGVGPATAAAIIDHRERNGPFASVDELLDVRGIGPAKLEAIRDLVVVG